LVDIAKITKRSSVTNLNVRNASAWQHSLHNAHTVGNMYRVARKSKPLSRIIIESY